LKHRDNFQLDLSHRVVFAIILSAKATVLVIRILTKQSLRN